MAYAGDLTPQQAWDLLAADERAVLVDVRTAAEWTYVGVPELAALGRETALIEWVTFPGGARNPQFVEQVRQVVPEGAPVVFLCRSGVRSVAAAEAVTAAGLTAYNVLEGFEGGLDDVLHRGVGGWKATGLPWRQS
ncbi:MAG: rhodanese-like domain-containing protein [Kineosporiaceae bacterium]